MAQTNLFFHYDNVTGVLNDINAAITSAVSGFSEADLIALNEAGGLKVWVVPRYLNRRHYAWTPIIFRSYHAVFNVGDWSTVPFGVDKTPVTVSGHAYICYMYDGADTVELPLYDGASNLIATLTASELKGEAVFNVAPVVRTLLAERPVANPSDVQIEPYVLTTFRVDVDGGNVWTYYIQNAVAQAGSDGDKSFGTDILLNDNTDLVDWGGPDTSTYPEVTLLNVTGSTITIDGVSYPLVANTAYRIRIHSQNDADAVNTIIGHDVITFRAVNLLPCCPAAVRWVNRKGGIDCFVFLHRQIKTKTAKTTGTRALYVLNPADYSGNRQAYAVEGERKLTVGCESVSDEELDFLTRLPYSPFLEWYDLNNAMWTQVTVDDFKNDELTDNGRHPYEVTLLCPAINMQF